MSLSQGLELAPVADNGEVGVADAHGDAGLALHADADGRERE